MKRMTTIFFSISLLISCNNLLDSDANSGSSRRGCASGDLQKILIIGEVEIASNEIPSEISTLACRAGFNVDLSVFTPANYTLSEHTSDSSLEALVRGDEWDYILIFESSRLMRDSTFDNTMSSAESLSSLVTSIRNSQKNTNVFFVENWSLLRSYVIDTDLIAQRSSHISTLSGVQLIRANQVWNNIFQDSAKSFSSAALWQSNQIDISQLGRFIIGGAIFIEIFGEALILENIRSSNQSKEDILSLLNSFYGL